jgi:hypothetical protein
VFKASVIMNCNWCAGEIKKGNERAVMEMFIRRTVEVR